MTDTADIAAVAPGRLRAAILADPSLHATLGTFGDMESFLPVALAHAQALGIALDAAALTLALRDDPLGLARLSGEAPTADHPPPGWLPIQVSPFHGRLCVDWAWFGDRPLAEPFFEGSIRRALHRPLNRLARYRTLLGNLPSSVANLNPQEPCGFIFHMSRCGSTLASQMLAADPRNVVVSEAAPLDSVVRLDQMVQDLAPDVHIALLRLMAGALGQKRAAGQERLIIKLDSWHTLALPLFRAAFPGVPWVFFYREPVEVLASQVLERGIQTVPEYLPPAVFGLTHDDFLPTDEYCAQVLGRTCAAVLEPYARGGGLLVNYREMPGALFTRILPHFGIEPGEEMRGTMTARARFDAKAPEPTVFAPREDHKRAMMTDALRALSDRNIGDAYAALEALRIRG